MTDNVSNKGTVKKDCWICGREIDATDRFCRACGSETILDWTAAGLQTKKRHRRNAKIMFLTGIAILLFAAIHRNPTDAILVFGLALPLFGAGAVTWRMT